MTPEQALNLLAQCAAVHSGNLQDHQNLQTALSTLGKVIADSAPKAEPVAEPMFEVAE